MALAEQRESWEIYLQAGNARLYKPNVAKYVKLNSL